MATVRRGVTAQGRPERPRRRRLTAAERHRRTFFAKLTELRKAEQAALEAGQEDAGPRARTLRSRRPRARASRSPRARRSRRPPRRAAPQQPQAPATSPTRSARAQARLAAAIERVGGPEAVLEALQPKRRDDGETMKWSSVCAEQAQGVKPGDPTFTAWVRLAATPVRDVKAIVNPRPAYDQRGGRGGRGRGGQGGGGRGGQGGGGTAAARWRWRPRRSRRLRPRRRRCRPRRRRAARPRRLVPLERPDHRPRGARGRRPRQREGREDERAATAATATAPPARGPRPSQASCKPSRERSTSLGLRPRKLDARRAFSPVGGPIVAASGPKRAT